MKSFFIDTNILFDFLADRKPFSDDAGIIFEYQKDKKIVLSVSAISFNNLYYVMAKIEGHTKAISLLNKLNKYVTVISLDNSILQNALNSKFTDFEDAIQYYSALSFGNIQAIITRNIKDFRHSELPIILPEIAVKLISNDL